MEADEKDVYYDCGRVRRADLDLRTKYYGLNTYIFMIGIQHYAIQITNYLDMYSQIKKDFDNHIKPASAWIDLVDCRPEKVIEKIEPLENIAENNEGLFLTQEMFESLIVSKFPKGNFLKMNPKVKAPLPLQIILISWANGTDYKMLLGCFTILMEPSIMQKS